MAGSLLLPQALRSGLALGLTTLLLVVLAQVVDLGSASIRLLTISPFFLLVGVVAMFANVGIACWRLRIVMVELGCVEPEFGPLLKTNLLCLFFAQIVPAAILADLVRVGALWRLLDLAPRMSALSVLHDRVLALAGLIFAAALTLPLLILLHAPPLIVWSVGAVAAGMIALVLLIALFVFGSRNAKHRSVLFARALASAMTLHLSTPRRIATQTTLAVAGVATFGVQLWCLARGLGLAVPMPVAILLAPLIYLAQVVPFFYSGFGVRETVAAVFLAGGAWTSADEAVALSLAVGLCNVLVSLPGAVTAGSLLLKRRPLIPDEFP